MRVLTKVAAAFPLSGLPWYRAMLRNRTFSFLPTIRTHLLVWTLITLIPNNVAYKRKYPLSSKVMFEYWRFFVFSRSFSPAILLPNSMSGSNRPDCCISVNTGRSSSKTRIFLPDRNRNTRTLRSVAIVAKSLPSGENARDVGMVLHFSNETKKNKNGEIKRKISFDDSSKYN